MGQVLKDSVSVDLLLAYFTNLICQFEGNKIWIYWLTLIKSFCVFLGEREVTDKRKQKNVVEDESNEGDVEDLSGTTSNEGGDKDASDEIPSTSSSGISIFL